MVSKYSTGIPILQPVSSIDTNLLYTSLSKKQDQYDKGFLAVQGQLDKIASTTDLVRKEDIEMFRNKMQSKVESFNQLGNVDLSDIKLASSLASDVQSIANDAEVKNAVLSTIEYKKLTKAWDDIQKNPKSMQYFNPVNYQYDIETKVLPWMNGQTKTFSNGNPTLFFNPNEDLRKTFDKLKGESEPTTDGRYIYQGEKVTAERLQRIAYDQMLTDSRYQKQMEVNAWYDVKSKTPQQITERAVSINEQLEKKLKDQNTEIANKKLLYQSQNKDISDFDKLLAQNNTDLTRLKEQKGKILSGNIDIKQLAFENQRDGLLDYASQFAWSKERMTTDAYGVLADRQKFDAAKFDKQFEYNKYQDDREYELKVQELQTKLAKISKTGMLPENGIGYFDALGMSPTGSSYGTEATSGEVDYIGKYNTEVQETTKRANAAIGRAVSTVLRNAGLDTAANEILTLSPNDITRYIETKVGRDTKGLEVRKMYNQIRQKYDDVRDGKDDGGYFIDNPEIAQDMKEAQKEFMILADLNRNYRTVEDRVLKERKISRVDLEAAKKQNYSKEQYKQEMDDLNKYSTANEGGVTPPTYEEWKARKIKTEVDKKTPYSDLNKYLSESDIGKTVFGTYIPNKDLMKSEDGGRVWGELTNMITADALNTGVKIVGKEGQALYGQQLGKEAKSDAELLKDAEIEDVLQIDSQGLAKVKFKGGKEGKETIIGMVQLSPDNARKFVGTKNTDRRFSEIIKNNGATSGLLNTAYKGITVPYTIGYDASKQKFYVTIRRGANPRKSNMYADSAEALEEMIELRTRQVYEKLTANNVPKEQWTDYTANALASSTSN